MPCGHVPLWANTPAAMDREVKTKLSRVASAINELAFRVLERPSINRESVCGKRSISFFPQTIDALAIVDAVALDQNCESRGFICPSDILLNLPVPGVPYGTMTILR